jgi:hypothetical protein
MESFARSAPTMERRPLKIIKATSVDDYKIVSSFHSLRKTLLQEKFADRLDKPLAYWALPNDRRLPLAFLGRTVKDLLATPFEELSATPGIGQKKISSLVRLLSRATKDRSPAVPFGIAELSEKRSGSAERARRNGTKFDPTIVSEALWTEWRATAARNGLGREGLGTLARSLQSLPTVIWRTPVENYLHYTLAEIRQLKTHGEKRVRVILEIFYTIHEMLSHTPVDDFLTIRLAPRFIQPLEDWIGRALASATAPDPQEVRERLTLPLLNQLRIDAGETIHELSAARLGTDGAAQSVRQQAKRMGLTRARVYQLLEECATVMEIRWPQGQLLLNRLVAKLEADPDLQVDLQLLRATTELFFPGKKRLADEDPED